MGNGLEFSPCVVKFLAQLRIFIGLCRQSVVGCCQLVAALTWCIIPQMLVFGAQDELPLDLLQLALSQKTLNRQQILGLRQQFGQVSLRGDRIGPAVPGSGERQRIFELVARGGSKFGRILGCLKQLRLSARVFLRQLADQLERGDDGVHIDRKLVRHRRGGVAMPLI